MAVVGVICAAATAEAAVVALLGVVAGAGGVGGCFFPAETEEGGESWDGAADHTDAELHSMRG